MKMFFDNFGDFFSPNFSSSYNWEELKKTGIVTKTTEEKDGLVITTYEYVSFDGENRIVSSVAEFKSSPDGEKLKSIEEEIRKAIQEEKYELAAELRDLKKEILNKNKK